MSDSSSSIPPVEAAEAQRARQAYEAQQGIGAAGDDAGSPDPASSLEGRSDVNSGAAGFARRDASPGDDPTGDMPIGPPSVDVRRPEFASLREAGNGGAPSSLGRFFDVNVTVSAELGRVTLPIGDLVHLGVGSVVELNRPVAGPVDLMANGVRIARGDVVVVDGCFAVHIKQIETPSRAAG